MMSARAWALPAGHDVQPLELDSAIIYRRPPAFLKKKEKKKKGAPHSLPMTWNFHIPNCSLPHIRHPLDPALLLMLACLSLGDSSRGTICMISLFVQLIKTSGRLAPELLLPWGDDRQLPPRPALIFFSPFLECLAHHIDSWRMWRERKKLNKRGEKNMHCRAISSSLWGLRVGFWKRTHFSFPQGLRWLVRKEFTEDHLEAAHLW